MGAWYSEPFTTAIHETSRGEYDLELPDAICKEIVYYALNIVSTDIDQVKFVADGNVQRASHKDYRLDFIYEGDADDENWDIWDDGCGIIWQYPISKGVWKFEMLVLTQGYAMAIGIADTKDIKQKTLKLDRDFEYNGGCYGYYHGGASTNVCADRERVLGNLGSQNDKLRGKWNNKTVGILADFDNHKMYIMDSGNILWQYCTKIPHDTSWNFHFWLHQAKDSVTIYPPQKIDAEKWRLICDL